MKFLTSRVVVCAIILGTMFCGTNVRAVVDEDDFSTLTSKAYVDSLVNSAVPTGTSGTVVTYNGTNSTTGVQQFSEVAIYDTANAYNASTDANKLATAGFVATKQNQIGATSDGTNNTPNYVYDATTNQSADGSVVTTGAADGTTGQRGIAKAVVSDGNGGYTNGDWLPTVNAMMGAISTATDALAWDSLAHPAAIDVYNTTFGSDTNNWTGNATDLINGQFLANALNMKQNKLPGQFNDVQGDTNLRPRGAMTIKLEGVAGYVSPIYITASGDLSLVVHRNADPVISYIDGTKTLSEFQTSNFGSTDSTTVSKNEKYIKGALVSLETLKDVYSALNTKITNNALPTGTSGTVVTYNGTNSTTGVQQFSEVAIYDTANAYNASTDANKLATAGFVATKQNQIGATSDGTNNTPNYVYDATTNQSADGSVVTTGAADGTTGQRGIAKAVVSDGNGGYTNGDWLPTVNAMMGAISTATDTLTWTSTETTAANNYSVTFDGETGNWPAADAGKLIDGTALANALSTKQRKITRSPLSFTSSGAVGSFATYIVPATIATSAKRSANESNEIDAQTYGIMDSTTANDAEGGLKGFSTSYYQGQFPNNVKPMDKFVPTVRAVALALADVDWDPIVWSNTHETLINAYSTSFAAGMAVPRDEWPAADADKLVNGTFIANALALKQNIIPVRGTARDTALRIVTYPQYGQSAGTIGELILDTASLYTTDNSHIPSSKLVSELLDLELDKSLAWHMDGLDDFFDANRVRLATKELFELVDMAKGGDSGAEVVLSYFNKHDVVPTMEVLSYALYGLYNALENQLSINTYTTSETSSSISGGNISIPTALTFTTEYLNDTKLTDAEQLFLVPWVRDNDNGAAGTAAGNLLTSYATNENIPTLDTLANALYGLYKTRKTRDDMVLDMADSINSAANYLYDLDPEDEDYTSFINSGYMDTFVPTISMLWHESRGLWNLIDEKQDKIPEAGYVINAGGSKVVTRSYRPAAFGGIAIPTKRNEDGLLGERWIVDAETDTTGWTTGDKLNYAIPSISYVQQKIPASGRYDLSSIHYYNTDAENDAHSWLNSEVKGNGIVTRTSTNGVVGERKIFEQGDVANYHDENLTENQMAIQDISIPTVAAVVEMVDEFSQNKKTCYEYKPGMPETDENCWLWEF